MCECGGEKFLIRFIKEILWANTRPEVLQIIKDVKLHIIGCRLFQLLKEKGMEKDVKNIKIFFRKQSWFTRKRVKANPCIP